MKTAIQKQLQINKRTITFLHEMIDEARGFKRDAYEKGDLEFEYHYHTMLKRYHKQLKDYVQIQKTLKQIMKT